MYKLNILSAKNQSVQIYNRSMGEQIIFYCEKEVFATPLTSEIIVLQCFCACF